MSSQGQGPQRGRGGITRRSRAFFRGRGYSRRGRRMNDAGDSAGHRPNSQDQQPTATTADVTLGPTPTATSTNMAPVQPSQASTTPDQQTTASSKVGSEATLGPTPIKKTQRDKEVEKTGLKRRLLEQAPDFGETIITIVVGSAEPIKFRVHENLIRGRAPFFEKALSRDWKESEEKIVKLPLQEPKTFELYKNWLYSFRIYSQTDIAEYLLLVNAYIMGDMLQDPDFKDAIIDAIVDKAAPVSIYPLALTKNVYENTLPASPLRRLFVDFHVAGSGNPDGWWYNDPQNSTYYTVEALFHIAGGLDKHRVHGFNSQKAPFLHKPCHYHEHVKAEKTCYKERLL